MGFLFNVLTLPVLGPVRGVTWIGEKLKEQAEQELYNEDAVRAELLALEMYLEMGEISEEEQREKEQTLLERLEEIEEYKRAQ